MQRTTTAVCSLALLLLRTAGWAASGDPDATFGDGGYVLLPTPPGAIGTSATGVGFDDTGRVLVGAQATAAGGAQVMAVRLLSDGSLDPAWSGDGVALTPDAPADLTVGGAVVDSEGRLLIGYQFGGTAQVARFADGTLDGTFGGGDGIADLGQAGLPTTLVPISGEATVALIVGGTTMVVRFDSAGIVDASWGNGTGAVVLPLAPPVHATRDPSFGPGVLVAGTGSGFFPIAVYEVFEDGAVGLAAEIDGGPVGGIGIPRQEYRLLTIAHDAGGLVVSEAVLFDNSWASSISFGTHVAAAATVDAVGWVPIVGRHDGLPFIGRSEGVGLDRSFGVGGAADYAALLIDTGAGGSGRFDAVAARGNRIVAAGAACTGTYPADCRGLVAAALNTGCGNAQLEVEETCDDGNTADADCCTSTCVAELDGSVCSDGNVCTGDGTCVAGLCAAGTPAACVVGGLAGELDCTFGPGGFATISPPSVGSISVEEGLLVAAGDAVIMGGRRSDQDLVSYPTMWRVDANGTLDASFGKGGELLLNDLPFGRPLALAADGQGRPLLLIRGNDIYTHLVRATVDGERDVTFGIGGVLTFPFSEDADITVTATDGFFVMRRILGGSFMIHAFDATGAPVASFGTNGEVADPLIPPGQPSSPFSFIFGILPREDGGLIVGLDGQATALVAYRADGTRDPAFGTDGLAELTDVPDRDVFCAALTRTPAGTLLASCGSFATVPVTDDRQTHVFAIDAGTGAPVTSYGDGGVALVTLSPSLAERPWDITALPDGRAVVAGGTAEGASLAVLSPTGEPDPAIGTNGVISLRTPRLWDGWVAMASFGETVATATFRQDGGLLVARWRMTAAEGNSGTDPSLCDDGDPCTIEGCSLAGCSHDEVVATEQITCPFDRTFPPAECAGANPPKKVLRRWQKAGGQVDGILAGPSERRQRKLDQLAGKIDAAERAVQRAAGRRRRPLDPACANALSTMLLDARDRLLAFVASP